MEEKFEIGILGGIVAGVLKDIPDAIFHDLFKFTQITFWDYAGMIAFKRHPVGAWEHVFSFLYEVVFSIFVAVLFIQLIPILKTRHYLFRGAMFGLLIWFIVHAVALVFQIEPIIVRSDLLTSVINSVDSVIYGIILAYIIHYLENKEQV